MVNVRGISTVAILLMEETDHSIQEKPDLLEMRVTSAVRLVTETSYGLLNKLYLNTY